jgi:hypothetical protein
MLFEHAVSHLKTVNISKILYPILNEVFQTEVRVFFFFCVCVCVCTYTSHSQDFIEIRRHKRRELLRE